MREPDEKLPSPSGIYLDPGSAQRLDAGDPGDVIEVLGPTGSSTVNQIWVAGRPRIIATTSSLSPCGRLSQPSHR